MNIQSIFDGLGEAKIARRTNTFFKDGVYLCEIQDVKQRVSEKPQSLGEISIIIEFSILEVLVDKGEFTTPKGEMIRSNQVGEVCTAFIKMSWNKSMEYLKAFLVSASRLSPAQINQITPAQWVELAEKSCFHLGDQVNGFDTSEWSEQPLKGGQIKVTATTILTNKNTDFTKLDFEAA